MESSASSKQNLCYLLGFSVTLTCFMVKVPQILSVIRSKSCKGISLGSLILEECGYSVMLTYHFAKEYPISAYAEYPFLVIQDLILIIAVLHFSDILTIYTLPFFALYFTVFCGLGYRWFPEIILNMSANLITPLGIFSKSAQIRKLYRDKNPGQVNIWTWVIVTYGTIARVITTSLQTGDIAVLVNFLTSATLNITIVCMIFYYKQKMKSKMY